MPPKTYKFAEYSKRWGHGFMLLPFSGLSRVRVTGWSARHMRDGDYMLLADGAGGVVRHKITGIVYYVDYPQRFVATLEYAA